MAKQVWGGAAPVVNPSLAGRLVLVVSLELPRGKAPQVKVELVQARIVAVMRELNFELQLVAAHGLLANDAAGADAWASPRAIGSLGGHLAGLDRCPSLLAENRFLWHLASPDTVRHDRRRRTVHKPGSHKPDATGPDARCVRHKARWKVPRAYHEVG